MRGKSIVYFANKIISNKLNPHWRQWRQGLKLSKNPSSKITRPTPNYIWRNDFKISRFKSPRELKTRLCFNEPRRKVITLTETPDGSRWNRKVSTYCTTESCEYELNSTTKFNLQIGFKVHNLKNKNKLNYIISNLYVSCSEYKTKNNKVLKQLLYGYSG